MFDLGINPRSLQNTFMSKNVGFICIYFKKSHKIVGILYGLI